MAGPYFLDDGGSGTNAAWESGVNGDTWGRAYTTWADLQANNTLASGEIVYVGADANITDPGAALTITGPTSGAPAFIISSTVGTGTTVSYAASSSNQIYTSSGAVTIDGSFALYGIRTQSATDIALAADTDEWFYANGCVFRPGAAGKFSLATGRLYWFEKCDFDLEQDTAATVTRVFDSAGGSYVIRGCRLLNAENRNRTAHLFEVNASGAFIEGFDVSSLTHANDKYLFEGGAGGVTANNIKLPATGGTCHVMDATLLTVGPHPDQLIMFSNYGAADAPWTLDQRTYAGRTLATNSVYRDSGATVEGTNVSWLVTTTSTAANISRHNPHYTPWLYGTISSTGSKTFTVLTGNATGDLTDAEVWLEVQVKSEATEAFWDLATDQAAITSTGTAQTDDDSAWTGTVGDYKQELAVTATVNVTGQFRARVCCAKGSVTDLYVDPKVVVS